MKKAQARNHRPQRLDRMVEDTQHDPYRPRTKLAEPSVCTLCGLVFHQGRWHESPRPENAVEMQCPACRRIADRFPAGYVTLEGGFLAGHLDEILHIVRNTEARERTDHPLQRIMQIEQADGKMVVTTTDVHLARRIGEAVRSAYHGDLDVKYSPEEYVVRVHWTR